MEVLSEVFAQIIRSRSRFKPAEGIRLIYVNKRPKQKSRIILATLRGALVNGTGRRKGICNRPEDSASRFQTSFRVIYDEIMPAISHYHIRLSWQSFFSRLRPFRDHFSAGTTAQLFTFLLLSIFLSIAPFLLPFFARLLDPFPYPRHRDDVTNALSVARLNVTLMNAISALIE